jgi:hypothetical protein
MRDATPRTSDRERRNWARRFDWLELRCQDRVRVRRTASELESSPIVIESQLSSSRSKSPELTRRRRLWLSESDIALGLFRVHVVPRGAASPAETCAARGSFPPVERSAGCARQWWSRENATTPKMPTDFRFRQVPWRDETRFVIFSVAITILGDRRSSTRTHQQKPSRWNCRTCLAREMHIIKPRSATFPAWNPIWSVRDLTTHPLTLTVLRAARALFVLRSALL